MKSNILMLIMGAASLCAFAQTSDGKSRTTEKAFPFTLQEVTLKDSWITDREKLDTAFLKTLDPERLLHNFRVTAGLPSEARPLEGWEAPGIGLRGHFVGHYLSAVSAIVSRYDDRQLKHNLQYLIDELYKCQQAAGNGYLSAFPEKDFDVLETRFTGVWAPYYTLHKLMQGLLDTYVRTGNTKAYDMLTDMASYVSRRMSALDRQTIERMMYTVQANPQNEAGGMNEVLYKLYGISHDPSHLALARLFDPEWFAGPVSRGEDILSGLHSNTHLALVNGFAQRYIVTGEEKYRQAAVRFWDILEKHHAYANGTSSGPRPNATTRTSATAEHWGNPDVLSNTLSKEIAESCVSHNTQKLSATLFAWTADPLYAETYMNMFYNAVLPAQSATSGAFVYHLPLGSPRNKKYLKANDFACCSGSCTEAFAQLNSGIYYHDDSTLWVNLYIPSKVEWKKKNVQVEQQSRFPKDTTVSMRISVRKKTQFALKLLVPSWAGQTEVYVNGEQQPGTMPGRYAVVNRTWHDGDEVKLVFHYRFRLQPMPDNPDVFAVFYGPTMLAFEHNDEIILKGNADEVLHHLSVESLSDGLFRLENNGQTYRLRPLFDIDKQTYGVYATIRNY